MSVIFVVSIPIKVKGEPNPVMAVIGHAESKLLAENIFNQWSLINENGIIIEYEKSGNDIIRKIEQWNIKNE
jgi:hypothetical protein